VYIDGGIRSGFSRNNDSAANTIASGGGVGRGGGGNAVPDKDCTQFDDASKLMLSSGYTLIVTLICYLGF
jgi:hypothetical protein